MVQCDRRTMHSGKIVERCPNPAAIGSMYCEACKAAALNRVQRMKTPTKTGLRWPTAVKS